MPRSLHAAPGGGRVSVAGGTELSALVAQLVEHGSNKPRVGGSSPSWSIFVFFLIYCVEEKNAKTSLFLGLFLARPVGATEQRVGLLI